MSFKGWKDKGSAGAANTVYGMGFLGSLFYFIQHATSFPEGLYGVLKAIFWPAFLIYKLLEFFKM